MNIKKLTRLVSATVAIAAIGISLPVYAEGEDTGSSSDKYDKYNITMLGDTEFVDDINSITERNIGVSTSDNRITFDVSDDGVFRVLPENNNLAERSEFRDAVGKIFSTYVSDNGYYQGMLTLDKDGQQFTSATLYTALSNSKVVETFNNNKSQLAELAASVYSDVKSDDWYADQIALPSFFGVLNGYEDGTLRPSNPITPAEVAKVISTTFDNGLENGRFNWYDYYYKLCANAFTYDAYSKMGRTYEVYMGYYNMTRAEIAYVIANYVDAGRGELQSYISSAKAGNLGSLANFSDCAKLATDDDGTYTNDMQLLMSGWIPSRYVGALAFLVDKGVFTGNGDGTMTPVNPVSRAEVFALLNRVCKATPDYNYGRFKGDSQAVNRNDDPNKPKGNQGWYSGKTTNYEEWRDRPALRMYLTDGNRGRAKVGDTVITADGTSYLLEGSGIFVGDTEVAGVGLPVAADLGRVDSYGCPIKDRDKPGTHEFGWISSDVSTAGQTYIVYSRTGEGHWSVEWDAIQDATKPQTPGSYDGEISADGYWGYKTTSGWTFLPNC